MSVLRATFCIVVGLAVQVARAQPFVNFESPHVHPLDITPDQARLLAVNTADNRLEVFDITSGRPVPVGSVPVGLDPVSVRARTATEAWVVNHVSDDVSIVSLTTLNVVATVRTDDEPCDVAFAGAPPRAFVSCSQANTVLVFDAAAPGSAQRIAIDGEDPRALAVSVAGSEVYVAIFESGNQTTLLGGGSTMMGGFPPNVVNNPAGPYSGVNPPPNSGASFNPPLNPGNPPPPRVGLIVRKNAAGQWFDDNNGNWTNFVSGAAAAQSGRPVGWDVVDHDLAIIDAATLSVRYASGLMNACMALAVNPASGEVAVVGTDATNQVRYEPVLAGRFLRVNIARVAPAGPTTQAILDLNPHLTYTSVIPFVPIPQAERDKSLGDPRGIVWNAAGTRGYVAGMGSNNLVVIDALGMRVSPLEGIPLGEGPTGVALDESRARLYVLDKFAAAIDVIDTAALAPLPPRVPFHDASPAAIKIGRKHLYDTHRNSGLGHIACASCHLDARMDRLAWDLGDPSGAMKPFNENCPGGGCQPWHPMKGPMTTQTLQDIVGKEPHHWRGDRIGLEEFAGAFQGLLGDDAPLPTTPPNDEMQEFENFLATITYPPNPYRNFDNTLPVNLPLPGHFTTGRFSPAGAPLPNGNAVRGLGFYRTALLDTVQCVTCHTLPTGSGPDGTFVGLNFVPIPPGPDGEHHLACVAVDGSTNVSIKVPHLRNLYDKVGCDLTQLRSRAGFGFLHDGSVDSIARFVNEPVFSVTSDQQTADLVAFMLSFSGSALPVGSPTTPLEPPGVASQDVPASVGWQTTLIDAANPAPGQLLLIADMIARANGNTVGLIVKGRLAGLARGWRYNGGNVFQSDRAAETITAAALQAAAAPGSELTYTIVPKGSETRLGIDRDLDGFFDRDELDACSNPADAAVIPGVHGDIDGDGDVDATDAGLLAAVLVGLDSDPLHVARADVDCDGSRDGRDVAPFVDAIIP
ncbi:MAG: hypothetical protein U1A27_04105 [Phycisphaerae bacterium]